MRQALSDFSDYVQAQQAKRHAPNGTPSKPIAANGTKTKTPVIQEEHDELSIIDSLGLSDDAPPVRLKQILLDRGSNAAESTAQFKDVVSRRLDEGHGEALLDLGQEDSGESMGLTKEEWVHALERLTHVVKELKADHHILMTKNVGADTDVELAAGSKDTSCTGKVMIRRIPEDVDDVIETRIAVVGNVDAGKSTMLGVLVKGGLDDGRGKARVNLFRHKHEVESGRTSSVGMEIMGFDTKGDVVASTVPGRKLSWEEIGNRSVRPGNPSDYCRTVSAESSLRRRSSASQISLVTNDT